MAERALAILGFVLLATSVRADTLTLRSNAEINGLVQFENDSFTVTARYSKGSRTRMFDRREVLSLEMNSRDFNSGPPPPDISMFQARIPATKDAGHHASDKATSSSNKKGTAEKKQSGTANQSVLASDDYDRATSDVIWLRNKTKVVGRIARILNGYVTIQNGNENKQVNVQQVATVLVAPQ